MAGFEVEDGRGLDRDSMTRNVFCESRLRRRFVLCVLLGLLYGCVVSPTERAEGLARRAGASMSLIHGTDFDHVVYSRGFDVNSATLHIYFSGDGTPWLHRTQIANDPTPRDPVALRLMLEDTSPSIFLGRPCYSGTNDALKCEAELWTNARYSDAVVESMAIALSHLIAPSLASRIVLLGYSGGGVLAVLVANRVARIDTVVTVGANLDTHAWTALHGYSELDKSVNPSGETIRGSLSQIHLVGENDHNVPPSIVMMFAEGRPNVEVRVISGFDHHCCWVKAWPELLRTFEGPAHLQRIGGRYRMSIKYFSPEESLGNVGR